MRIIDNQVSKQYFEDVVYKFETDEVIDENGKIALECKSEWGVVHIEFLICVNCDRYVCQNHLTEQSDKELCFECTEYFDPPIQIKCDNENCGLDNKEPVVYCLNCGWACSKECYFDGSGEFYHDHEYSEILPCTWCGSQKIRFSSDLELWFCLMPCHIGFLAQYITNCPYDDNLTHCPICISECGPLDEDDDYYCQSSKLYFLDQDKKLEEKEDIKRETKKPHPNDDHKGCMIHDEICLDEQMKAGCIVELFICYNCRFMGERGLGVQADLIKSIFGGIWE